MGKQAFDLVVTNARLVNVHTREIHDATIGITDGIIAYVADSFCELDGREYLDAKGRHVIPGLIDSHMHIESSMALPAAFAEAVVPRGTVAVAADPHEIANVLGADGVKLLIRAGRNLPLKIYFLVPSTVPSAPGFETAGASFSVNETNALLDQPGVIGLGEVMDFWGVVETDPKISEIVASARTEGRYIEGHCPVFSGRNLQAYIAAGIDADHTIMNESKVRERLRAGMTVQIQNRFITPDLMRYINTLPCDADVLIVTDDVHADRLCENGHLDANVRKAIACGLDPIVAVQAATIRAARRLRLYDRGSVAPGKTADFLILDSLDDFSVNEVVIGGKLRARGGRMIEAVPQATLPDYVFSTMKLNPLSADDFRIRTKRDMGVAVVRVIESNGESSFTKLTSAEVPIVEGFIDLPNRVIPGAAPGTGKPKRDLRTMAVLERHGKTQAAPGARCKPGIVSGLGAFRGAMASSYAHDCHNLVVVGESRADMAIAANRVIEAGGGLAAVLDGKVIACLELPIAGILSPKPMTEIAAALGELERALKSMGVSHADPISLLTLIALAVSPEAKITDLGIVDVVNKKLLDVIVTERSS